MVMIFAHPKVREYLLEQGYVYTFRRNHPKTENGIRPQIGKDWAAAKRTGKKIADIYITPMESLESLKMVWVLIKYVKESGFHTGRGRGYESVSRWTNAIKALSPDESIQGWIYKVTLREAS